ncbi:hypothetical protein LTR70_005736 [Exophiala xenobiotica]|uniref:Uncharacterized protein n=1 Tax=Lithohypha guttulata TaxID=1690604 RepID=A0ABR0K8R3_9EURO|nr:hypothetical protein LTR24_005473 [Lithohypha guttulata]KAK5317630.1 hypothetical protein LTR70_005736 [Exophiala xenobiotica]
MSASVDDEIRSPHTTPSRPSRPSRKRNAPGNHIGREPPAFRHQIVPPRTDAAPLQASRSDETTQVSCPDLLRRAQQLLDTCRQHLAAAQRLQGPLPEVPRYPVQSGLDRIDPLCTQRQRALTWYHHNFGIIGLAWYITEVARYEATNENAPSSRTSAELEGAVLAQALDSAYDPTLYDEDESSGSDSEDVGHTETDTEESSDAQDSEKQSKSKPKPHSSWNLIIRDAEQASPTLLYYLASMPPELIDALIAGNLPSCLEDENFRRKVQPFIRLHDCQGVYCLYLAVTRQATLSTQQSLEDEVNVGKSLTLREMLSVYNTIRMYIDVDHADSARLAKLIDRRRSGARGLRKKLNYSYQRRYASGSFKDSFNHHLAWLDFVGNHYIKWARHCVETGQDHLLEERLRRCFVYVGLASNVSGRAPNHWKHLVGTSPVMGLVTAVVDFLFPDVFSVTSHTYQILRTVDRSHIGLDEKIITVLCGAYPWDGGLSTAFAAGSRGTGPRDNSLEKTEELDGSHLAIQRTGVSQKNINRSLQLIQNTRDRYHIVRDSAVSSQKAQALISATLVDCEKGFDRATTLVNQLSQARQTQSAATAADQFETECEDMLALMQEFEEAPGVANP